jgi:hypothetical protein
LVIVAAAPSAFIVSTSDAKREVDQIEANDPRRDLTAEAPSRTRSQVPIGLLSTSETALGSISRTLPERPRLEDSIVFRLSVEVCRDKVDSLSRSDDLLMLLLPM